MRVKGPGRQACFESRTAHDPNLFHLSPLGAHPFHAACVRAQASMLLASHIYVSGSRADWFARIAFAASADLTVLRPECLLPQGLPMGCEPEQPLCRAPGLCRAPCCAPFGRAPRARAWRPFPPFCITL